jgi:ribosomal-protein-alanine N-acetyltransferase
VIERLAGDAAVASSGALAGLLAAVFDVAEQRWDADSISATLSVPGTVAFVARAGGSFRACALLRIVADEGEILTLAVVPAARRQGLGRRLIAACVDEAGAVGARRLHLEVGAGNVAARALYARAGFIEAGRRPGYYRGANGREDAIIMARDVARS